MNLATYQSAEQLDAAIPVIESAPADRGVLEMVVRRPSNGAREVLDSGELVVGEGLKGDNYLARGSSSTADGLADPDAELNIMSVQAIDAVSDGDIANWSLAGDQLFIDLDLSVANLPTGARLAIGDAIIEVTAKPHNGCAKFAERYGIDAARWVNSHKHLRLRGLCARVIVGGQIRTGGTVRKTR